MKPDEENIQGIGGRKRENEAWALVQRPSGLDPHILIHNAARVADVGRGERGGSYHAGVTI